MTAYLHGLKVIRQTVLLQRLHLRQTNLSFDCNIVTKLAVQILFKLHGHNALKLQRPPSFQLQKKTRLRFVSRSL